MTMNRRFFAEVTALQPAPMLESADGFKIRRRKACQFESGRGHHYESTTYAHRRVVVSGPLPQTSATASAWRWLLALLACLMVAACGGGGTSPDPEPHKLAAFGDSMTYIAAPEFGAALGVETHNAGVGSTTSSEIAAALLAYPDRSRSITIWAGHNNFRDPGQVLADVAAMVAAVGHGRYVVLGMVYADRPAEYIGGSERATKAGINATLAATYPGRYVDPAAILAARHNGTAQDLADVAHGVTPTSLRAPGDGIHISRDAARIVAVEVAAVMRAL